ncbi:hypothetical protein CDAR_490351 [Caerostris darwini]|uniref:Uncharacterized protein n=1 Tax=Caerostris darwini TaxID=1538125 RepID=A0AAV4R5H5_9ARAC|nr:hypothetical protein CDAR_490351 [Caerostris darwini]
MSSNIIYQLSVLLQAALRTRQYKNMREKRVVSLHPILALNENMYSAHSHAISPLQLENKNSSMYLEDVSSIPPSTEWPFLWMHTFMRRPIPGAEKEMCRTYSLFWLHQKKPKKPFLPVRVWLSKNIRKCALKWYFIL